MEGEYEVSEPILTVLSYSGGVQSHALLEMVINGDLERPKSFLVLNSNPGMEDERSYPIVEFAKERCSKAGIDFITAGGDDLYHDLTTFKERGLTRLDLPPFWTKNRITGKKGKLKQGCTQHYKIKPMRKALRLFLNERFGVSLTTKRLPPVVTWIGFAADEAGRVKPCDVKFITFGFPLIELGMDKSRTVGYYIKKGIAQPPRSVCAACFSHGLAYLEDMYVNRPEDWDKAVKVDDSIRDMRQLGVKDECYVSETLIPLRELPNLNFKKDDIEYFREHRCNSGVCFV